MKHPISNEERSFRRPRAPRPAKTSASVLSMVLALIAALFAAGAAQATTLERMSLEKLVDTNSKVLIGQVVDTYSYWNEDATFILTDVVIAKEVVLQGRPTKENRLKITLMGGQVDDLQTVILGGANLEIGSSYVLFLSRSDLPGVTSALTVRDHSQGVFDLRESVDGELMAISQADSLDLVPDEKGLVTVPGGAQGLSLDELIQTVNEVVAAKNGREVK